MANLFTSQTPTSLDNSDGTPGISVGTTVRFAVAGTVTGIRFYATTTVGGTYTGALYQVTDSDVPTPAGTLLVSKVLSGSPTSGAWNTITFDTPVSVSTGTLYRAVLFSGAGRYVFAANVHASDIVNGDITADANGDDPVLLGTLRQATFSISAALTYPATGATSNGSYFADVEFTAAASGTITPTSIPLLARPGAPTVTNRLTVTPASVSLAVRLGQPTVTTPAPEPVEPAPGGWNGLLSVAKYAAARGAQDRERDRNPLECPEDGWPLTRTERGLHCEFGGHIVIPGRF